MSGYLIDTDILIDHLRGDGKATEAISSLVKKGSPVVSSVICEAEIFSNVLSSEEKHITTLFRYIKTLPIDSETARLAGQYRQKYKRSDNVETPDALIAATAKLNDLDLVTRNKKHYPMTDIKVITPY